MHLLKTFRVLYIIRISRNIKQRSITFILKVGTSKTNQVTSSNDQSNHQKSQIYDQVTHIQHKASIDL